MSWLGNLTLVEILIIVSYNLAWLLLSVIDLSICFRTLWFTTSMASSSCYETIYISHVYSIIEESKQKRKSARFSCTFKCFVSCLLSIVLITCQKNSPQYIYYECTCNGCWFVFPLKRDFQPWSVAAVGECKRVSSYLVWYCFFLLYFIHSILFLLFLGMIFLSKKKRFCLMLDLYFG